MNIAAKRQEICARNTRGNYKLKRSNLFPMKWKKEHKRQETLKRLMQDVPRGHTSRFLKAQSEPQSQWMSPENIMDSKRMAFDPENPGAKIMIGSLGDKLIGIDDDRHFLKTAGSRAGKSVGIIGNMVFYQGSVVATDPKGELATKTARARAELGQKVIVLDPFENTEGNAVQYRAAYNPMTILKMDNPFLIEDAVQIADGLVLRSGQDKDPHWDESAKTFITGLLLYVMTSDLFKDSERHLITVRRLISRAMTTDDKTEEYILAREATRTLDVLEENGYEEIAAAIEGSILAFFDKAENERAGVLSTVRRHTDFLDYKSMHSVLTGHDFDLPELKTNPNGLSIFVCLPAGRMGMCSRWIRIILNQLLDAMEREKTKTKAPVLVCLDEFPVLGFMKQLQDAAGQIAGFGVKLWVIIQDWGQGEELYGKRWESFAANSGLMQAFGNVDLTTTEYLSKRLGKTRIESTRDGEVSADQRAKGLSGRSEANELYDLLTPDEIARVFSRDGPMRRQLILYAGYKPMVLQRVEYYDENGPFWELFKGKID